MARFAIELGVWKNMAKMNFTEANFELSSYVLIDCAGIGLFDSVGYRTERRVLRASVNGNKMDRAETTPRDNFSGAPPH
ncbi:hypothetical protein GB937_007352 [Aspergillus fischeri]|nr:hypothetical protein GB937_007352 [Aspergillus fischeri]